MCSPMMQVHPFTSFILSACPVCHQDSLVFGLCSIILVLTFICTDLADWLWQCTPRTPALQWKGEGLSQDGSKEASLSYIVNPFCLKKLCVRGGRGWSCGGSYLVKRLPALKGHGAGSVCYIKRGAGGVVPMTPTLRRGRGQGTQGYY